MLDEWQSCKSESCVFFQFLCSNPVIQILCHCFWLLRLCMAAILAWWCLLLRWVCTEVFEVMACSKFIHSQYIIGDEVSKLFECVCILAFLHFLEKLLFLLCRSIPWLAPEAAARYSWVKVSFSDESFWMGLIVGEMVARLPCEILHNLFAVIQILYRCFLYPS